MNILARNIAQWLLLPSVVVVVVACGGGNGAAPVPAPAPAPTNQIGPSGGTVAGPNGAQVAIPAGALAASTAIVVDQSSTGSPALPAGVTTFGSIYAFTPHNTAFALPATITVPFNAASVPAGRTPVLFKTNAAGAWEQVAGATLNAGTVTAQVTSFSWTVVGVTLAAGTWQQLGGALDNTPAFNSLVSSVVLDSTGNPVVAWMESGVNLGVVSKSILVKRWDGAAWVQMGGDLAVRTGQRYLDTPSIDIDRTTDYPVVAWSEERTTAGDCLFNSDVYVKRWNGVAWQQLGGALNVRAGSCGVHPQVRVTSAGDPIVAWWETPNHTVARQWNGAAWVSFGGQDYVWTQTGSQDSFNTALTIDGSGNPYVVFGASGGPLARRGSIVGGWNPPTSVRADQASAGSWGAAIDAMGRLMVAYSSTDGTSTAVRARGLDAGAWSDIGPIFYTAPLPTLALTASVVVPFGTQAPVATWFVGNTAGPTATSVQSFRQWDGASWFAFAPDLAQRLCAIAVGATAATASAGPVAACVQTVATSTDVVVYRLVP